MPYSHKPIRLLMLGDTGNFFEPLRRTIRREAQRPATTKADAICLLGDNFYPGGITKGGLKHFLETFQPLANVPRLMLLGNHDYNYDARIFLNSPHWTKPPNTPNTPPKHTPVSYTHLTLPTICSV